MSDPAEIARRLSPAQKRALLWLPGDGNPGIPRNEFDSRTIDVLCRYRLLTRWMVVHSVEECRRFGRDAWIPDAPTSIWDAYSLSSELQFSSRVRKTLASGLRVRALLEQETRDAR